MVSKTTSLSGVGHGLNTTLGKVSTDLMIKDIIIGHEFHVVNDNFPIPVDVIIGLYFVLNYNGIPDYSRERDLIILRPDDLVSDVAIPLLNAPEENSITIPARSEVIRFINVQTTEEEYLIPHHMIDVCVLIAYYITSKSKSMVRLMNTTDNNLIIRNVYIRTESLNDYKIVKLTNNPKDKDKKEILRKLSKKFPEFVDEELNTHCSKFIEIFALETEKISLNNLYKQKLKLSDNQPVCIKNYRIRYSHKDEVNLQVFKLIDDDIVESSVSEYNIISLKETFTRFRSKEMETSR